MFRLFRRRRKPAVQAPVAPRSAPIFTPKRGLTQQRRVKVPTALGFQASGPTERRTVVRDLGFTEAGALYARLNLLMFALLACFGMVAGRLAFVALMPPVEPRASIREMPSEALRRGNIYDRNGILLAATLQVYSLSADPQRVLDPEEIATKLPDVIPTLNPVHVLSQLTDPRRRFVWLKRRLTPAQAAAVHALGLPGLELRREFIRVYPHQELASHVLGASDIDNNGLSGIERAFNDRLNRGEDVVLTIDVRLQQRLRQRVAEALGQAEAKAAWGVVLKTRDDAGNPIREVVAMVSLPDFDPHRYGQANADTRFNRVVQGSYEMGSTFKLFTVAQGLINQVVTPETLIDAKTPLTIGRFRIRDYRGKNRMMTVEEVLRYSSNMGAARIADLGGPEAQQTFLMKLGLMEPLPAEFSGAGQVKTPTNWGRVQTFTIAFGHGMSVTPLHMANGAATLAAGEHLPPTLVKREALPRPVPVITSPTVLHDVHRLMRDVVLNGSGRSAQLAGYDVGGKTGTAEKIAAGGGYQRDKNLVSFVAALPVTNPEYVVLVMVDEPVKGFETGGRIAAPTVGAFLRDLTQVIAVPPYLPEVREFREVLQRARRTESDPFAVHILTNLRSRSGLAAGIRNQPSHEVSHD